jgi:hypothetical protein
MMMRPAGSRPMSLVKSICGSTLPFDPNDVSTVPVGV